MKELPYGVIEAKLNLPPRSLLVVPHNNARLVAAHPAFGPGLYNENVAQMRQHYAHPLTGERMSFKPATTSESLFLAAYKFKKIAKPQIFDSSRLQLGPVLRTDEGVWTNPLNAQGQPITNENLLKRLLTNDKKVNGIYLLDVSHAFIPYDSFRQEEQEAREFAEGGLARGLEPTPERVATTLESMVKTYPGRVCVVHFGPVEKPTAQVVGLNSNSDWRGRDGLFVDGGNGDDGGGHAFGVLQ